jgi:hypothetical protein
MPDTMCTARSTIEMIATTAQPVGTVKARRRVMACTPPV